MMKIVGRLWPCIRCNGPAEEEEDGWYRCWWCGGIFKITGKN